LKEKLAVTTSIRFFYGNDEISADVILPDLDSHIELTRTGLKNLWSNNVTPYDDALVVVFDGEPRHLRVVDDLTKEMDLSWETTSYFPDNKIIGDDPPRVRFRELVAEEPSGETKNR
jgi:hypothetical protein